MGNDDFGRVNLDRLRRDGVDGKGVRIDPEMPLDKAALIGCGVTTGVGAVINTAAVRPGETVAVLGCGGIGLNAIQAAALVGAGRVIAIDRLALRNLPASFRLTPGMPVTADIKIGQRTVLSYLLGRVLPVAAEAMREP